MWDLLPACLSALGFAGVHAILRHGPPFKRLTKMYEDNQAAIVSNGDKSRRKRAPPAVLASQAEARVLNNVHNILQVRAVQGACQLKFWIEP